MYTLLCAVNPCNMTAVYEQVYMKIYQGEDLPEPKSMLEVSSL